VKVDDLKQSQKVDNLDQSTTIDLDQDENLNLNQSQEMETEKEDLDQSMTMDLDQDENVDLKQSQEMETEKIDESSTVNVSVDAQQVNEDLTPQRKLTNRERLGLQNSQRVSGPSIQLNQSQGVEQKNTEPHTLTVKEKANMFDTKTLPNNAPQVKGPRH